MIAKVRLRAPSFYFYSIFLISEVYFFLSFENSFWFRFRYFI